MQWNIVGLGWLPGRPAHAKMPMNASSEGAHVASANGQQQGIQSVEVAMRVLEAIERLGGPAALSAVAAEAGLAASTTHRYLVSLARVGLVAQDPTTGLYDLGSAARRLGIEAVRRSDDVNIATRYAASLRDATGHTVNVSVWADSGPTIVRWEYGRYPLPILTRVGSTLPVVDSSAGRVFLAYLPRAITQSVVRTQHKHGESSTCTPEELAAIVADVRKLGISKTVGAVLPGLIVFAVPVFGPGGVLSLVLAAVVPTRLGRRSVLVEVEQQLKRAGDAVSIELGGPGAAEMREAETRG